MIEVINRYASLPLTYGDADCCQFVAECVEAERGYNPMAGFTYADEDEGNAIIDQHGGLLQAILATLGQPYAGHKNGDVALCECQGVQMAGVIYNDRVLVRTARGGVTDWPLTRAILVWET